jgi:translin
MTRGSRSSARPPATGPIPEPVLVEIEQHLREREERREGVFRTARSLRRRAQATIARLHGPTEATADVAEIRRLLAGLARELDAGGRADLPLALDALQEGVEAALLGAIAAGERLPSPTELGVDPEPYLLGLGDVVGEVRRRVTDALSHDDLTAAEAGLALMQALTDALRRFDTARAIVVLKPKQDQARSLLERTRGEVVMARLLARSRRGRP